jgi:hypothetical protein
MNLDQVTIEIRPRSAWEAVDLGILMAKKWWWPMMKIWLLASLPFFIIAQLIPAENWLWCALFLWWFKPLYERPLLHIVSRAVFNDLSDTRSTLRLFPSLAFKQLFSSLTWRRLSPNRSMDLPVLQLEGLAGSRRQERLNLLHREDSSPASWLSFMGLMMEVLLWTGFISLFWALMPREIHIEWANLFFEQESAELNVLKLAIWYFAMALTAPFYVACGFALYLNRRIKLEAWDIDIAFRRIVNKRRTATNLTSLVLAACLGFGVFALDAQRSLYAEDHLPIIAQANNTEEYKGEPVIEKPVGELTLLNRQQAMQSIKEVMQQKEFSRKEIRRTIKFDVDEDEEPAEFWEKIFTFLRNFEGIVAAANAFEILLWCAVIALVLFVIYRYRNWLAAQFVRVRPPPPAKPKPVTLFGMDVTRESLPEDISANALQLLRTGDTRAALALLYRASLFHLIYTDVEIHDGHTERECAQLMREHFANNSPAHKRVDYFVRLTRVWQRLAYGHLLPDAELAENLCATWNHCWLQPLPSNPTKGTAQ